ncbi:DMT family transporter [Roseovarius sp. PS-C2]|uniref:DMT family transporter n=1 Tax=Roseovarius sp. PS-C2 TaxID=2820814 RepID=UPI001C0D6112|nr:DMT family transporter [Roseovarius sp. PS-C2]MBU3259047.1 DMT family transporter [Roseovarius sp. PS-C2]
MRLFLLVALTMGAFAANSVLNRLALAGGTIDPVSFGTIRLVAGAVMLFALVMLLRGGLRLSGPGRIVGGLSLLVYIYGFSLAYTELDSGLGALILFGVVQITMFSGAVLGAETLPARRWIGAGLAFAGLVWLLLPGQEAQKSVSLWHGALMALAGIGWGIYSLNGRRSGDALQATAANFILSAPVALLLAAVLWVKGDGSQIGGHGAVLAIVSGGATSGMGYALWYTLLPRLEASLAAVAQLTVPVLAMLGGMLFLSEPLTWRFVSAAGMVMAGVALSAIPKRQSGSR